MWVLKNENNVCIFGSFLTFIDQFINNFVVKTQEHVLSLFNDVNSLSKLKRMLKFVI